MKTEMTSINDLVGFLRSEWNRPKEVEHRGVTDTLQLQCTIDGNGVHDEVIKSLDMPLPKDIVEFWKESASARLFVDVTYGQWGLEILHPNEVRNATSKYRKTRRTDYKEGDLIIGRFLGDSDLLLIRCNERVPDYGSILVVLPIDRREDWYKASDSFRSFLEELIKSQGDKYWEI